MNQKAWLRVPPWVALVTAVACSGASTDNGGSSGTSAGSSGSGSGSTSGAGGVTGSDTSGSVTSGTGGSGVPTSGVASGTFGSGVTVSGADNTSGATSGTGGSGVASGAPGDAASGAASGATSGSSSGATGDMRTGMSAGCGKAPVGASSTMFTRHTVVIPSCTGCTAAAGNCTRDCIAPEFSKGGVSYQSLGAYDFNNRNFSLQLPTNYQPGTPYPVFYGGHGCGGNTSGAGWTVPGEMGNVIEVGLDSEPVGGSGCFPDGGSACSGSIPTIPLCVNGPEVPYFRAVSDWVEANFCVDLSKQFIGGSSSGGWEAMTLGCGEAERLRGFYSVAGGKREHRWPCTGPVAAFMMVDTGDGSNKISYSTIDQDLDSYGSQAERDELLTRNGCVGTATTPAPAPYASCATYTGCPAAYPVWWCVLPGGHQGTTDGAGTDYQKGVYSFLMGLP